MNVVRALILSGFGINTEEETAAAYRLAGAEPHVIHLSGLLRGDVRAEEFDIVHIPGGFSFGDDLGAGRALANRFRARRLPGGGTLFDGLVKLATSGGMVVGICNGFQVLVQVGLVPNVGGDYEPEVSLVANASGRFEDRWVRLRQNPRSPVCLWNEEAPLDLPVHHGQGRLVFRDADVRDVVVARGLDVLAYCDACGGPTSEYPANPNGSDPAMAGLCDPSGNVIGTMAHPEDYLSAFVHPDWPRRQRERRVEEGDGVQRGRLRVKP
jgi:phosphoribosylformylglycinamidine (FGAM) synthase-like amidotransferase family enzyme